MIHLQRKNILLYNRTSYIIINNIKKYVIDMI